MEEGNKARHRRCDEFEFEIGLEMNDEDGVLHDAGWVLQYQVNVDLFARVWELSSPVPDWSPVALLDCE
jgi:hypothetical protein